MTAAFATYSLCALVSILCAALLMRAWARNRSPLILKSGIAFIFLAVSNLLLVVDLYSKSDLALARALLVAIGLGILSFGLIAEQKR